jgi:hypothetical protein
MAVTRRSALRMRSALAWSRGEARATELVRYGRGRPIFGSGWAYLANGTSPCQGVGSREVSVSWIMVW